MEKNNFLNFNDLIYQLYSEASFDQMKLVFLKRLKSFVPYSYASIMMTAGDADNLRLTDPVCNPASFAKAETEYIRVADIDHLDWIMYSSETVLLWEGDVMNDRPRLASPIYQKCYNHYNIYDTIQMSIVYNKKVYGILTLYRTRSDHPFSNEDTFYLQAFSKHLNLLFEQHLNRSVATAKSAQISSIEKKYRLTRRESEILQYIFRGQNNTEIAESLMITDNTLQKHLQNIYRKCNVSARWDLLKL